MVNDKSRKRLPPYVSYRTFRNFIDGLQQRMPSRIDRSYWGDMLSGSTGTQLMASLRFLGLIDEYGRPTPRLKPLVAAKGDQRHPILRDMANDVYGFVLKSQLEPQSATYSELEEFFHDRFQVTGDLSRKCLKFFIELAKDAGIPLSPFITKRFRAAHGIAGTKAITKRASTRTGRNLKNPQTPEEVPYQNPWDAILLTKFPTFDPTWSDEVKLKWFGAFDELLKRALAHGQK
jgi:hypothetical protein